MPVQVHQHHNRFNWIQLSLHSRTVQVCLPAPPLCSLPLGSSPSHKVLLSSRGPSVTPREYLQALSMGHAIGMRAAVLCLPTWQAGLAKVTFAHEWIRLWQLYASACSWINIYKFVESLGSFTPYWQDSSTSCQFSNAGRAAASFGQVCCEGWYDSHSVNMAYTWTTLTGIRQQFYILSVQITVVLEELKTADLWQLFAVNSLASDQSQNLPAMISGRALTDHRQDQSKIQSGILNATIPLGWNEI